MIKKFLPFFILVISVACSQEQKSTNSDYGDIEPVQSKGALIGKIFSNTTNQPLEDFPIRLAIVHWNEDKTNGAYVIDAAYSPYTTTNFDGIFSFSDLEPNDYVIVIGDIFAYNKVFRDNYGKIKVFSIIANEVTNAGEMKIDLP